MRGLTQKRFAIAVASIAATWVACQSGPTPAVHSEPPGDEQAEEVVTASPEQAAPAQPSAPPACAFDPAWLTATALPTEVGDSDCSFHQFMWQSFAYLAQSLDGGARFESWMPTYGLFVKTASAKPTPWGTPPKVPCKPDKAGRTADKPLPVYSSITKQAGVLQPLIDRSDNAVYYGVALNRIAYDWVTSCELYRYGCGAQLADQKAGVDLIKQYPQLAFPNGSVELKTAWKVLSDAEKQLGTFYTVTGQIQPDANPKSCKTVTLGLVGLHVVSKTANHPEFIWATFEHKNNAPDCTALDAAAPLPGGYTFFDTAQYDACKAPQCTNTFAPGTPAMVCREHPWGDSNLGSYPNGNDCNADPNQRICQPAVREAMTANTQAMQAINASASSAIVQSSGYDKVWANYELVGNLWARGGAVPPITQAQAGSLSAANTVMETFVQNGQAGVINPSNCFTCHDMVSSEGIANLPPAGLSHIFRELAPKSGGCKDGKLPQSCVAN
ncbi:MAG: hypothetical protein OEZ06_00955 [Myxococcales bacterium]|nr:hypothetical protein [Myxococcales bacterium]